MSLAIEVEGLTKHYDGKLAVDDLSLSVAAGEVYALLGPNGAGKTTTVEILEGHREPSAGSVSVLGFEPRIGGRRYRERIGIVLQASSIEPELTVAEALDTYGRVYPKRRETGELIGLVGLEDKAGSRVKTLSGGQQRRLELALGLVGDPDLLFLDEPTTGFDPSARRQAWSIIEELAALGKTILLTTHYMEEARLLADRIGILADGRLIAEGTPEELVSSHRAEASITFELPDGALPEELPVAPTTTRGAQVEYLTDTPTVLLAKLTSWAVNRDQELLHLSVQRSSLEDVYLGLTSDG